MHVQVSWPRGTTGYADCRVYDAEDSGFEVFYGIRGQFNYPRFEFRSIWLNGMKYTGKKTRVLQERAKRALRKRGWKI